MKECDDPNGQNDRTYLDRENQFRVVSSKLENQIWTRPADHYTGQRLLKTPQLQALQKTALDHSHTRIKTSCITGGNHRSSIFCLTKRCFVTTQTYGLRGAGHRC